MPGSSHQARSMAKRMQATARMAPVVSSTHPARRRLIRGRSAASPLPANKQFTLALQRNFAPGGALAHLWKDCLKTAKDLQDGKQVGRIGFVQPEIVIKGNMITSITGGGFLYAK